MYNNKFDKLIWLALCISQNKLKARRNHPNKCYVKTHISGYCFSNENRR